MRRISISTMAMPDETGAQAIAKAKLYGYDGIDMRLSPVSGELTEQSTDEEIAALRACAEAAGITIASLMCYNSAVTAENDSDMKMADTVLRALSIADTLGTKLIRIFAGDPNALPEGEHICRTAQVLGSVFARYRGNAQIAIQNHLGSYTAAEAALLCETLGDARLGVAFAPDHVLMMGETLADVAPRVRPHVKEMYISDVAKNAEGKYAPVLPGEGEVPLIEAARLIGDFGGFMMFKWEYIWHRDIPDADFAMPRFIRWAEKLL